MQFARLKKRKRSFDSDGEKRCSTDEIEKSQTSIPKSHEMLKENAIRKLR